MHKFPDKKKLITHSINFLYQYFLYLAFFSSDKDLQRSLKWQNIMFFTNVVNHWPQPLTNFCSNDPLDFEEIIFIFWIKLVNNEKINCFQRVNKLCTALCRSRWRHWQTRTNLEMLSLARIDLQVHRRVSPVIFSSDSWSVRRELHTWYLQCFCFP